MIRTLGIDLGSHSIGWAIRDISETENQIVDKGVITFEKGVGEGKSGEFPLVQKRTESRGKRRNYQAEKYRKWALLEFLIEKDMCPLTMEELNEWRKYTKGGVRKYPQSSRFIQWLRYDFDRDGKSDFKTLGFPENESHYLFRMLAIREDNDSINIFKTNPHILGRVFYHLVQRRGFRGRDEEEARTIMQGSKENGVAGVDVIVPYIHKYKTLGAALYYLQKETNERIRKRYNLRSDYEAELKEICSVQKLTDDVYKRLWKAIIWQRPLRSQKDLVGLCTFEKNKPRCPVSHPLYEEYRSWVYINNLKIEFQIPSEKLQLLEEWVYPLFYNSVREFKLKTIAHQLTKIGGRITAKTGTDVDPKRQKEKLENTKAVSATLLNSLREILGEDWKERYGWVASLTNSTKDCKYSFEDIWHVLFTFDDKEKLFLFGKEKLGLSDENSEKFTKIKLQQGYATLSLSAIKKILPYLKQGYIYSHAIYLANLPKVLGKKSISEEEARSFSICTNNILDQAKKERTLITVVNGLISDQLNSNTRFGMDTAYELDHDDLNDISKKTIETFGEKTWQSFSIVEQKQYLGYIMVKYLEFLRRSINYPKEKVFLKSEPIHQRLASYLVDTYNIPSINIKYLWHPSEQEQYPPVKSNNGKKQLGNPQPISRGFKNPMALKTLHKLKHLINYLLLTEKIDEDTRVVIEIARELNDANRRKAIERWQRAREKENDEYKRKIHEMALEHHLPLEVTNKDVLDKYRLWVEQNQTCIYTGKIISFTDLFMSGRYDFEHTIPATLSFDNELKNLTICEGFYNKQVKQNKFPTQVPNYYEDTAQYTAIKPRLEFMERKVAELELQLEEWKNKTKFASSKDIKDACIQKKHLIKFDLDYWRAKLHSFTLTEYKAGWRNSQLKDTQIVTKYAIPYLKTIFTKVEAEKASIVATFKEIYEIQPKGEKDRAKHSHHAIDAAVLTLIPPAAIRDKILLNYNKNKEERTGTYHENVRQWKNFRPNYILSIEEDTLINFLPQFRTLAPAYKNVTRRGKPRFLVQKTESGKRVYQLDEKGEKIPLVAKGDSIRGQLHKESFYGAIDINGKKWLVERYPVSSFTTIKDCKNIVDDTVRNIVQTELESRMAKGLSFDKAKLDPIHFPNRKATIKKVRCKVAAGAGYLTKEKALEVHKHGFPSKHEYKQYTYAQNEENTLCLYYQGLSENVIIRAFRIIGLYELAGLKIKDLNELKKENYYRSAASGRGKNKATLPLIHIFTLGTKVIVYEKNREELKDLSTENLLRRVFRVYKYNEPAPSTVYVYLQNHLEARKNEVLGNGEKDVDFNKYQPRIFLSASKFNCAIEHKDFTVTIDGAIRWLF